MVVGEELVLPEGGFVELEDDALPPALAFQQHFVEVLFQGHQPDVGAVDFDFDEGVAGREHAQPTEALQEDGLALEAPRPGGLEGEAAHAQDGCAAAGLDSEGPLVPLEVIGQVSLESQPHGNAAAVVADLCGHEIVVRGDQQLLAQRLFALRVELAEVLELDVDVQLRNFDGIRMRAQPAHGTLADVVQDFRERGGAGERTQAGDHEVAVREARAEEQTRPAQQEERGRCQCQPTAFSPLP